jgi:hypothetical protein
MRAAQACGEPGAGLEGVAAFSERGAVAAAGWMLPRVWSLASAGAISTLAGGWAALGAWLSPGSAGLGAELVLVTE